MSFVDYKNYLANGKNKHLSPHFTEFNVANSQTALAKSIDNTPSEQIIKNATLLINNVLEPLCKHFMTLPDVHCMFRCADLNNAVKGAHDSQHLTGQAVDLTVVGQPDLVVVDYIRHNLPFDQMILEVDGNSHWVHVSFSAEQARHEVLKFNGKQYISI